jgi:cyclopropane-fatty-acyl-phospholipid synthase
MDTDRWPGLHLAPSGPRARVAAAIARRIFQVATARLGIAVIVPNRDDWSVDLDSAAVRGAGTNAPTIVLHRPDEFFRRIGNDGLIGFGEAFQTGSWSSPDLGHLLTVMAGEITTIVPQWMQTMRALYVARAPRIHRNTVSQTRGNIAAHYDLSNDLFRTFLDPTLSYSSALFPSPVVTHASYAEAKAPTAVSAADLEEAQGRKIERMLDQAGVGAHTRVLEIGTGWGELAIRAARRGATVVSVTL